MSRISVIIPSFNNGPYIRQAIDSVLGQTRQPDEIIIVDDGSTDDTASVVSSFSDNRIRYLHQPRSGVSVARNRGLEVATGDYLAFLDADDHWRSNMLELQSRVLDNSPSLVCCFGNFVRFIDPSGEVLPPQFTFFPELDRVSTIAIPTDTAVTVKGDPFDTFVEFGEWPAFMLTMLFRSSMMGMLRFNPRLVRCQDADFVLRTFLRGGVAFRHEILADVRRHGRNATSDVSLIALDKLRALECVGEDLMIVSHQSSFRARLIRARFDAANALIAKGRVRDAYSAWWSAISTDGSALRKVRGTLGLALAAILAALIPKKDR